MKTQGLKTKNPQQGIFDILAEAVRFELTDELPRR